jgi:hypothetical protein
MATVTTHINIFTQGPKSPKTASDQSSSCILINYVLGHKRVLIYKKKDLELDGLDYCCTGVPLRTKEPINMMMIVQMEICSL